MAGFYWINDVIFPPVRILSGAIKINISRRGAMACVSTGSLLEMGKEQRKINGINQIGAE